MPTIKSDRMRKIYAILISLTMAVSAHAAINSQYDFEGQMPSFVKASGNSAISLSTDKFKDGKQSIGYE